jgi:Protein of unknown function (DUF3127).
MALEISGRLLKVLPEQRGNGRNGEWVKQDFILETTEQYPKKVCLSAWGDKVADLTRISVGDTLTVSFNVESREFNERWYTDLRAWRISTNAGGASAGAPNIPGEIPTPADSMEGNEDLPF